ncbi:MAG: PAS domain-containing protein [Sulfurimonas sp.]|nr:PAS domain-containing protein [Sulfurimonas sp.]MDQ7059812.1 PAS domain-containing protein [Sulfurimonas sp.]
MSNVTPINEEFLFEGSSIISQTDSKGVITFANRKFAEVSGYRVDELVGQEHNIIRHPDMPRDVFTKMWNNISTGHTWNGLLKNLRKDGLYYWVDTEILPIVDDNNNVTGFIASRRTASRKNIQEMELSYQKMNELQD